MINQGIVKELSCIYFILINVSSFICYYIDKKRAIRSEFRISELTLFTLAFLGGALGSLLGMKIFNHKTKKKKFIFGMTLIFIFNIGAFIYLAQFLIK